MSIKIQAKSHDEATLLIYGDIGESYWSDGDSTVTVKQFRRDIDAAGDVQRLNIHIHSAGGNIFDAQAIYSILKRHPAKKKVYIDGLAASAASLIAMVGDQVVMPTNALLMIHRAWTVACGNTNDFQDIVQKLAMTDETLVGIYSQKTQLSKEEIFKLMDVETWMEGKQALAYGFIDEIEDRELDISASIRESGVISLDRSRFKNLPQSVSELIPLILGGTVPTDVSREKAPDDEAWEKPTLSDFTDKRWTDLSDTEKKHVAGHYGWAAQMPPDTFGDLKLPHHRPSDGAVVWRGTANAAARLSQADIPDDDLDQVRGHLASHYHQWARKAPWEGVEDRIIQHSNIERTLSVANELKLWRAWDAMAEVLWQVAGSGGGEGANNKRLPLEPPKAKNTMTPQEEVQKSIEVLGLRQRQIQVNKNKLALGG